MIGPSSCCYFEENRQFLFCKSKTSPRSLVREFQPDTAGVGGKDIHRVRVERPTDLESVVPKWSRSDHRNKPEGGIGQSYSSDSIPITPRPLQLFEPQFIPFPGLGKEWRLRMSKARGFTNQRITNVLMFLTWGNLEARILPNHADCSFLACNMQLLFFNSRFGPVCFLPGQASRRQTPICLCPLHLSASNLGLRTKSRLLLKFPSRSMLSDNL